MAEYPHSEMPPSNVSNFDQFRAAHHPKEESMRPSLETEPLSDALFAARLLDAWAQLPEEVSVHQHILHDAEDDERLAHLIQDEVLIEQGATLHFAGDAFATSMKGYALSPQKIQALETMYRVHFIYQRNPQIQSVRHPMLSVLFGRVVEED